MRWPLSSWRSASSTPIRAELEGSGAECEADVLWEVLPQLKSGG